MKFYQVGGAVRDEILGVASKDIDFTVVMEDSDFQSDKGVMHGSPFTVMVAQLEQMGFRIYKESPEFFTARAKFPKDDNTYPGLDADFVLARKERGYADGRRPDSVEVGTLEDDLARRDFTMNAVAKDTEGNFIDPHNGRQAIAERYIQAVGDPHERLAEDALRAVRALRFSVTLGFRIRHELAFAMQTAAVLEALQKNISSERIKDELNKMFAHSTLDSLKAFEQFPELTRVMFSGRISLEATMKERKKR